MRGLSGGFRRWEANARGSRGGFPGLEAAGRALLKGFPALFERSIRPKQSSLRTTASPIRPKRASLRQGQFRIRQMRVFIRQEGFRIRHGAASIRLLHTVGSCVRRAVWLNRRLVHLNRWGVTQDPPPARRDRSGVQSDRFAVPCDQPWGRCDRLPVWQDADLTAHSSWGRVSRPNGRRRLKIENCKLKIANWTRPCRDDCADHAQFAICIFQFSFCNSPFRPPLL